MISRAGPAADSARDQHEVKSDSTTRRRFVKHRDPRFHFALCRAIRNDQPRSARNLDLLTLYYVYRGSNSGWH